MAARCWPRRWWEAWVRRDGRVIDRVIDRFKRRSCADYAESRSAYVDGYLEEEERQALLAHLSDCAACRDEVAALQRLRSLLTDSGRQQALVPSQLADRLAAIAEADATDADASRRLRLTTASVAGVVVLLVLIAGIGYVAAPVERDPIADPTAAVRSDFAAVIAQSPLTSAGIAAALTVDPQRLKSGDADLDQDPTMAGPELDEHQIAALLQKANWASARVPYSGIQQVVAPRDDQTTDQTTAADVSVDFAPGAGSQVVVRALDGKLANSGTVPTPAASRIAAGSQISALSQGYRLTGMAGGTVLARPVIRIQAWHRGAPASEPAAVWWIDTATGLVLRQEVFDDTGRLALSARYTSLQFGSGSGAPVAAEPRPLRAVRAPTSMLTRPLSTPLTTATFTTASAGALSSQGWFCHSELAGLQLVRLRADAPAEPGVLHMVYTDGLSTVSVFERRGRLADPPAASSWDPTLGAYRTDAMVNTATWQSGNAVFTVATDGPTDLRDTVVAALPHDRADDRTTIGRIRAGWSRILHLLG